MRALASQLSRSQRLLKYMSSGPVHCKAFGLGGGWDASARPEDGMPVRGRSRLSASFTSHQSNPPKQLDLGCRSELVAGGSRLSFKRRQSRLGELGAAAVAWLDGHCKTVNAHSGLLVLSQSSSSTSDSVPGSTVVGCGPGSDIQSTTLTLPGTNLKYRRYSRRPSWYERH